VCGYDGATPVRAQWRERLTALFREFRTLHDIRKEAVILATGSVPAWTEVRYDKDPAKPCRSGNGTTLDDPNCFSSIDVVANKKDFENELLWLQSSGDVPRFGFVPTTGLTSNGEVGAVMKPLVLPLNFTEAQIHFSAQAGMDLGDRPWQAFLTLHEK